MICNYKIINQKSIIIIISCSSSSNSIYVSFKTLAAIYINHVYTIVWGSVRFFKY